MQTLKKRCRKLKEVINRLTNTKLFNDTLVYGLTNAFYTGLPLILLPFLVVVLEPKDYGMVDLFRALSMFMTPFLGLSAVQSISRFYFDLDNSTFKKFVSSIQIFQFCTFGIAITLILLFQSWLEKDMYLMLLLSTFYFLFNQFTESLLAIFRVERKAKNYLIFRVCSIIIELFLMLILYKMLSNINWTFRVIPTVSSALIIATLSLVTFYKLGFRFYFSWELLKQGLVYSSPLVLHMISGYILNLGDRFFIRHYLSNEELGNYAIAYQIGMAVNFFYTSFNLAWTPTYFKWMKDGRETYIYKVRRLVYIGILALSSLCLLCWLVAKQLLDIYTNYKVSTHIVIVVLVANVIFSMYKFEANYFFYSKKTRKLSTYSMISAVIAIIFNFILIPKFGIVGAAYATLISFVLIFVLVSRARAKHFSYKL